MIEKNYLLKGKLKQDNTLDGFLCTDLKEYRVIGEAISVMLSKLVFNSNLEPDMNLEVSLSIKEIA